MNTCCGCGVGAVDICDLFCRLAKNVNVRYAKTPRRHHYFHYIDISCLPKCAVILGAAMYSQQYRQVGMAIPVPIQPILAILIMWRMCCAWVLLLYY